MPNPIFNRTKIIATIGPSSANEEVLTEMIMNGVDVCRLNFSHGTHEEHLRVMKLIDTINTKHGLHVSILCDLQGPKIRVGTFNTEFIPLETGKTLFFTTNSTSS